jgi:TonB family protein
MMLYKPLYITVLVSAILHLAVLAIWWSDERTISISTSEAGVPLNIAISEPHKSGQLEQKKMHHKTVVKNTPVTSTPVITTKTVSASKMQTGNKTLPLHSKPAQASTNRQEKYALLNNHMIDYLSSEFKLRFKYPMLARKRGWQGEVLLDLDINRYGEIAHIVVRRSSGYQVLDHNAVRTFKMIGAVSPELKLELAKEHHLSIPVIYKLTGG